MFSCKQMPGTIEELEATIQDTLSEANSILLLNQNVLHEYESRQRQVPMIFFFSYLDGLVMIFGFNEISLNRLMQ
jgi:heme oxygenase